MEITLLLGPAGAGKTYRCLAQVRQELKRSPDDLPLVFLAPKQATYQIERELLTDPELPGFTRLQVVGFETLARLIIEETPGNSAQVLSDLGRVMILRALLTQERQLRTYHASARMEGFAQQVSTVLNEFQQARLTPEQIRLAATRENVNVDLCDKLMDLALLLERYTDWLRRNNLYDPGRLLATATDALNDPKRLGAVRLDGLWLDGFAELSEQELEYLAALVARSQTATLAFCLGEGAFDVEAPWHSIWNNVSRTVRRCHSRLKAIPNARVSIRILERDSKQGRFRDPGLAHLERHWTTGQPFSPVAAEPDMLPLFPVVPGVKVLQCRNPSEEAAVCAREILTFVRTESRRFRDVAVLLRSLVGYDDVITRTFTRYGIPFFIDRREPISHHPLTELIRYAIRLPLDGWLLKDWCGALKTGLLLRDETAVDQIENIALEKGWNGNAWLQPVDAPIEKFRQQFVPPFEQFAEATRQAVAGPALVGALRELFSALPVADTLQRWSEVDDDTRPDRQALLRAEIHNAVWAAIEEWFDAVGLAFQSTMLTLGDWAPIIETGLANLTVGVIPPALDQVLVGTVDRSRNPDLKMAVIMGLNETVFPAPPPNPPLLSEYDRGVLRQCSLILGQTLQEQLGFEQYLGYIACTRARERLVLTFSERDNGDKALNASSLIQHVKDLLPQVTEQLPAYEWHRDAIHPGDLIVPLLKGEWRPDRAEMPLLREVQQRFENYRAGLAEQALLPEVSQRLYGPEVAVSVSQLEDFAACRFSFFVKRGLRVDERREFKVDRRLNGIFQHEVLQRFHLAIASQGKRWRDLQPGEARMLVRNIGLAVQQDLESGIFAAAPEWRFAAETLIQRLERLVSVLIGWAPQYEFEPRAVELGFGGSKDPLPAWRINLENGRVLALRGRIDRVDVDHHGEGGGSVVVMDYKESGQEVDDVRLRHGLDLQLIAYLAALRSLPDAQTLLKCDGVVPAGGFYLKLRNTKGTAKNREEALQPSPRLYQHTGRFRGDLLERFDNRGTGSGDQFNFRLTKAEEFYKRCREPMERDDFEQLVADTEDLLREFGRAICEGDVSINPYRYKQEIACSHCEYAFVCRFDPWTQPYRVLRAKQQ